MSDIKTSEPEIAKRNGQNGRCAKQAFTLVELLVVIGIIAIFATLLLPALAKTNIKSQSVQCMNNYKQLMSATLMYPDDYDGVWIPNEPTGTGSQSDWVNVSMDWSSANFDNTNTAKLVTPQFSFLAPYIKGDYGIFHCPGDKSFVLGLGARVRSVSMSQAVGSVWISTGCLVANQAVNGQWLSGANIGNGCQTSFYTYGKASDFRNPGPALTWVLADEHMDSINDAGLAVQCAETGIGAPFIDRPANYHNGAATFAFADGHTEIHKWAGNSLGSSPAHLNGPNSSLSVTSIADQTDLTWMQQRTSAKIQ